MNRREDMLAGLIAQAGAKGTDLVTLRAIVEEASELGIERVLQRLNLADDRAQADLEELRELLSAWRATKTSVWKAVVEWLVRGGMAVLLVGIAVRLNVPEMLR